MYFAVVSECAGADGVAYQRVVGKGDPAPGAPGLTFGDFAGPGINRSGQVVFGGLLAGAGVNDSNNAGYWAGGPGSLALVARKGSTAPGTNAPYGQLPAFSGIPPPIDSVGSVAFVSPLNSGTPVDNGTWAGPPGGLVLVERYGDPAPGAGPGALFTGTFNQPQPTLNEGRVAFIAEMHGAVTDADRRAIWAGPPTAIAMVARAGSPAPGAGGATFESSSLTQPVLNAGGTIAFGGRLTGSGVNTTNDAGIWLGPAGALQLALRTGTLAPGTNKTFGGFNTLPGLNSRNQITFEGQLRDAQGRLDNGSIWAGTPDALRLVAESGLPAPGTDGTFANFIAHPAINDLGQVTFTANVLRPSADVVTGLWTGTPDTLSRVASVGDAAPIGGTVPAHFSFLQSPWLNNAGQVAFLASLDADDRSFENKQSLWVRDALGELHLIAREGGTLDVDGIPRTVQVLNVGSVLAFEAMSTGTGFPVPFNDAGQLAFQATFADGDSALFIATVPVPEPGGAAALLAAGTLMLRRRKHHE